MSRAKNPKKNHKSNDSLKERIRKLHNEELGLNTPDHYFSSSKKELLDKIFTQQKSTSYPFYKERVFLVAAATVAILVTLAIFRPNTFPSIDEAPKIVLDTIKQLKEQEGIVEYDLGPGENDVLVSSLFMEEDEVDAFVESYVLEEVFNDEAYSY